MKQHLELMLLVHYALLLARTFPIFKTFLIVFTNIKLIFLVDRIGVKEKAESKCKCFAFENGIDLMHNFWRNFSYATYITNMISAFLL